MKHSLTILLILFCLHGSATDYYFSNAGNDGNLGTQASPYATITKLNSLTLAAGDHVYFRRGDTFYGKIRINRFLADYSSPVTIGAYGTGANPIITGLSTVTGWSNLGSNIWESSSAVSTLSELNIVLINGVNTPMGRYPNTGWLTAETSTDNTSITDNDLTDPPNWTGATVVMRKVAWVIDKSPITNHTNHVITYSGGGYWGSDNMSYFIQNDAKTLDQQNEWYYNPSTQKIRIYSTSSPVNVQVPTIDTLVYVTGSIKVVFDGIDFIGANKNIIFNNDRTRLTVQNCNISYAGWNAIFNDNWGDATSDSFIVKNNTINQSNNGGIVGAEIQDHPYALITGNTVTNTFPWVGSGLNGDNFSVPISINHKNSNVSYNRVDLAGGYGIAIRTGTGSSAKAANNFVTNFGIITQDVGGIYIADGKSGTVIENNIVLNGQPNQYGLTPAQGAGVNGIYVDYASNGVIVRNNTVKNVDYSGIRFTNANNITLTGNTILDAGSSLTNWQFDNAGDPNVPYTSGVNNLSNSRITQNIFASTKPVSGSFLAKFFTIDKAIVGDSTAWGNIDSNFLYYYHTADSAKLFKYQISKGAMHTTDGNVFTAFLKSLYGWRTNFGYETHSRVQPQTATDTSQVDFFFNTDLTAKTITLPYKYLDMKGTAYNAGSITLQPYTSAVLIQNGSLDTIAPPTANVRKFYVSTSGNDANDGNSPSTAWQTLSKVNSITLQAGDTILLKRGDIFIGTLNILSTENGTSGSRIIIDAYGSGAKPIITGFTSVTSWTNLGSNIWESTSAVSTLAKLNVALINGVNTPMGRYPNTGWFTYQSASGNTSITSSSVNSTTTNWTGADLVLKKERWATNTGTITAHSGGTLTYTDNGIDVPQAGYGFFIQNDVRTLDTQNEWYYTSGKTLKIYSTTTPGAVQVPTVDSLMVVNGDYITVQNIEFKGANNNAIKILNNSSTLIDSCVVSYAGDVGIFLQGSTGSIVQNSYIHHTNGNAIRTDNNTSILSNTVSNSSMIYGLVKTYSFGAITGASGSLIQYNNVDSSGYNGIMLNGRTNATIKNNFVNHSCLLLDDGAGIYTSLSGSNTVIKDNIVLNTRGSVLGNASADPMSFGIYLDSYSTGITVQGNTVSGSGGAGGFFSNDNGILVRDNTFFGNSVGGGFSGQSEVHIQHICCQLVRDNDFYNNIYFTNDASKYSIFFYSITDDVPLFGLADSNYFANPLSAIGNDFVSVQVNSSFLYHTLPEWSSYTGQDIHSQVAPYFSKTSGDIRFEYNATNSPKTVPLDYKYIDPKSTEYNTGIITLQPYTSAVLIKNGLLDTIAPPTVNAGTDKTITTSTTSLSGTVTSASGYIATYLWTKISGTGGTITNSTTLNPSLSGLTTGTYVYRLTATQSDNQTAYDEITVTVNIPVIDPPTVSVESDKTVNTSTTTLTGTATPASGKTITSTVWSKTSGANVGITGAGSLTASVSGLTNGNYTFQLLANQSDGQTATASVNVTVAIPLPPTVSAGTDKTISTSATSLAGTAVPASGYTITSVQWTKISGTGTLSNSNTLTPSLSGLSGTSVYRLTVTQSDGQTSFDEVSVTVEIPLDPPTVNAGSDKTVTVNNTTLTGSASAASGATITSYSWTKVSGTGILSGSNSPTLSLWNLGLGTSVYRLTVTQSDGQTAFDEVSVTYNSPPIVPSSVQTIELPPGKRIFINK